MVLRQQNLLFMIQLLLQALSVAESDLPGGIVCDGDICYDPDLLDIEIDSSGLLESMPEYSEPGYLKCTLNNDDFPSSSDGPVLSLVVLDNAYYDGIQPWHANDRKQAPINFDITQYPDHDYPLLTPQIRIAAAKWKEKGLLRAVGERVLFIQNIEPKHCTLAHELFSPFSVRVYGHPRNVGIAGGLRFLITKASGDHLLFLERDFVPSEQVNPAKVAQAMAFSQNILEDLRRNVELVLVRNLLGLGRSRGHGGVSSVCVNKPNLDHAWHSQVDRRTGRFKFSSCVGSTAMERFFTATAALDFCTERAVKLGGDKVEVCGPYEGDEFPRAYCYSSLHGHWTNNPFMARRSWLMAHIVPKLPRCEIDNLKCLYAGGIETNKKLQCSLRELNYTIAQTEGIFRHLNRNWASREKCESPLGGYWIPDKDQCIQWT